MKKLESCFLATKEISYLFNDNFQGGHKEFVTHQRQSVKHVNDSKDVKYDSTTSLLFLSKGIFWKHCIFANGRVVFATFTLFVLFFLCSFISFTFVQCTGLIIILSLCTPEIKSKYSFRFKSINANFLTARGSCYLPSNVYRVSRFLHCNFVALQSH